MKRDLETEIYELEQRIIRFGLRMAEGDLTDDEYLEGAEAIRRLEIKLHVLQLDLEQQLFEGRKRFGELMMYEGRRTLMDISDLDIELRRQSLDRIHLDALRIEALKVGDSVQANKLLQQIKTSMADSRKLSDETIKQSLTHQNAEEGARKSTGRMNNGNQ
jgi:hypothetical protein